MKKTREPKNDKIQTSPSTSDSLGTSTSSNLTIESSDLEGDGSRSLIPEFKNKKSWTDKVTKTVYDEEG